jgi:gliding motility-associated-like protein
MDKDEVCSGESVVFTSTSENADLLCWEFGDGGTATGKNPAYQYKKPGTYTVKVTAKNAGCTTIFESPQTIEVKNPLVNFEFHKSCADPYLIEFVDKTDHADLLSWDLGDGHTTTDRSFSHRYDETGNYEVTLTGVNTSTNCSVPVVSTITIQDIKADFSLATEIPCKNNPTQTFDNSEFVASWLWYVDAQLNAQTQNPILTFQTAGQHKVRLDAFDSDGCSDTKEITIQVPDITGNFAFSATSDCEEFTVQFNDASVGSPPILDWHWDFGDGTTSDEQHPLHVFHEKDSFDISLRLTNPEGNCSLTYTDAIIFSVPVVDFNAFKTTHCLSETVRFSNTTLNAKDFLWTFEAGGQSILFTPITSYATAGSFDVTLAATDKYGCRLSLTRPDHIIVAEPIADFEAFQTSGECPPLTSIFRSTSVGSNLIYNWNFGNGILSTVKDPACTYTKPGVYDVQLNIRDQFGCTDSKLVEDLIHVGGPSGNFEQTSLSLCSNAAVDFQATTTNTLIFEWDFGDGKVVNLNDNKTAHVYSRSGSYNPSLILIDDKNCKVVADGGQQIIVHDSTAVEFTYEPLCIFNGEGMSLKTSNQDNDTHQWILNGTVISEGIETSAILDSAGVYEIELQGVNEFGCVSSSIQKVKIHGKITMIPNVFTANGDGYNESFVIPGVENSEWALRIFNRWGREVFSGRNYLNSWRGDELAAGTYYYYLNNQVCADRTYKGYINVMK